VKMPPNWWRVVFRPVGIWSRWGDRFLGLCPRLICFASSTQVAGVGLAHRANALDAWQTGMSAPLRVRCANSVRKRRCESGGGREF